MSDTLAVFAYAMIAIAVMTSVLALAVLVDLARSPRTAATPARGQRPVEIELRRAA